MKNLNKYYCSQLIIFHYLYKCFLSIRNGIGIKINWIKSNGDLMYEKLGTSYFQCDDRH